MFNDIITISTIKLISANNGGETNNLIMSRSSEYAVSTIMTDNEIITRATGSKIVYVGWKIR